MTQEKKNSLQKKKRFTEEEMTKYINEVTRHTFDEAVKIAKIEAKLAYFERRLTQAFDVTIDVAPDEAALYAKRAGEFLVERRNLSMYKAKLLGLDAATRQGLSALTKEDDDVYVLEKIKKKIEENKRAAIDNAVRAAIEDKTQDAEFTEVKSNEQPGNGDPSD